MDPRPLHRIAALLALALPCQAQSVYKWVDAQGRTHFSDQAPPAQVQAETVALRGGPAAPDPELQRERERTRALLAASDQARAAELKRAQEAAAERARRQPLCRSARHHLADTREANVLTDRSDSGEKLYLSDAEKAEYERDLAGWIRKHCD